VLPRAFVTPTIDGRETSFFEWFAAGRYDPGMGGGAMHQAQHLIDRIYYAFNADTLFFRVDARQILQHPHAEMDKLHVIINLLVKDAWQLTIPVHATPNGKRPVCVLEPGMETFTKQTGEQTRVRVPFHGQIGAGAIIEAAVPFNDLSVAADDEVYFYVTVEVNGREMERCPVRAPLRLQVPRPDFESRMWVV
jgi:hypothetical protein